MAHVFKRVFGWKMVNQIIEKKNALFLFTDLQTCFQTNVCNANLANFNSIIFQQRNMQVAQHPTLHITHYTHYQQTQHPTSQTNKP